MDESLSEEVKFFPVALSIPEIASFNPFESPISLIKSKARETKFHFLSHLQKKVEPRTKISRI